MAWGQSERAELFDSGTLFFQLSHGARFKHSLGSFDRFKGDGCSERQVAEFRLTQCHALEDVVLAVFCGDCPDLLVVDEAGDPACHAEHSPEKALSL